MATQLRLLVGLYWQPRRALAALVDEGSILFGAVAVLLVAGLFEAGTWLRHWDAIEQASSVAAAQPVASEPADPEAVSEPRGALAVFGSLASTSALTTLVGLVVLYTPASLLALTLLAPIGSFGVTFRRDFGALLACTLQAWAATHLPFALATLPLPWLVVDPARGWLLTLALRGLGALAFATMMVAVCGVVFGTRIAAGLLAALAGGLPLLLQSLLAWLASPFLLFYLWMYLRGDLADVQWSLSARRSFKRHLEVATLNPRDADAHLQLGLIHLKRRQLRDARQRFEKALEIDPGELDAHFQLGRLARLEGGWEEAIRHFEAVVAKDERYARHEVWREIGATYLGSGAPENARWALEKFVAQRPHDPEGHCLHGEALVALGRRDEARTAFLAAVEAADTTPGYRRHEVGEWRRRASRQLDG